ncbi:MAG TPA: TonB-dependent receptor [Myxococcota bacterium]|nr:TonB-dependent receptor [Myxococcota bacterium]
MAWLPDAAAQQGAPAGPQLSRAPELIHFVEAEHPTSEAGNTGSVVLVLTLREDGTVESATVETSAGEAFDHAAIAAAQQFLFSPAEVDGKPTRIRILYRYDFVWKVQAPTTAIFTGVVRNRENKTPLEGVEVRLGDGRQVRTNGEGRFRFEEVPPGTATVTLQGERLTALSTEEEFVAGEQLDATYDVFLAEEGEEGDDLEILVSAPSLRRQAVSTEIAADEARKVPGTQGDVLKVVESMPGVARASLGSGALVVWGAAPEDTGVYVDGVPVPRLYHDGGLRSIMGSTFVNSVELVPGGYGAAYGRGLGGLVAVRTAEPTDRHHAVVAADLYDASAGLSGPLGARAHYAAAGRYSYVAPLLDSFYPGVEDYFPVPHYYDAQLRLDLAAGPSQNLSLTGLLSSDQTARSAPNPDPARAAAEDKSQSFQRVSLHFQQDRGDGSVVSISLFGGADQTDQIGRYGAVETAIGSDLYMAGLRAAYRQKYSRSLTLEGGLDLLGSRVQLQRRGSVAIPAREGDLRAFGQPPPDQISSDVYTVHFLQAAPYVEADVALFGDRLHLVPGLRADPYVRSISRATPQEGLSPGHGLLLQDFQVEPRLSLRFTPREALLFTAAYGRYGQAPSAADLSASFGTPTLPIAVGDHVLAGATVQPLEKLSIAATGFYIQTRDLAMRNADEQPRRAEALAATGRGRSYGVQVMTRLESWKNAYGWLSYTLAWSERQDREGLDWRPSDYDQRHVLTALGGYTLPFGIEVALRVRVATGYPRSPVIGAYYDSRRNLYQPLFGAQNSERLPTFFQADARLSRSFSLRQTALELSLEVQNLSNQQNAEEYIYSADYRTRGAITGLPILPVLGLRWSY